MRCTAQAARPAIVASPRCTGRAERTVPRWAMRSTPASTKSMRPRRSGMLLEGKVVVISGVGPGMGQSLARIAAAEGAKVGLGARNGAFLEEVAANIRAKGGDAVAVSTDVTSADQCRALAEATTKAFGRIDGLVNS